MIATMGASAVGGIMSAQGTLAGGKAAATAGAMQQAANENVAQQLEQNATLTRATAQRQALDERLKSNMVLSDLVAKGAASGVNLAGATPIALAGEIGRRGEYQALTTFAAGENQARGEENQAAAERYSGRAALIGGQLARRASVYNAGATLAGSGASMLRTYGALRYPSVAGSPALR